ncbi:MAG: DUF192 domain-containing protein, partial [Deltaproteobacteria bacterium]|nr:DUF192 domain-containing protein [Deltaproteobacteria bacterium]
IGDVKSPAGLRAPLARCALRLRRAPVIGDVKSPAGLRAPLARGALRLRGGTLVLGLWVGLWLALGCSASTPENVDAAVPVERIPVTVSAENGQVVFRAEIADTPEERARGLMYRTELRDDEGMLFLFTQEGPLSFWMKNTLIPLDMVFITSDHTILGIVENATPKTETSRNVPGLSQFVLEINGGLSQRLGLKAGQKVSFYAPTPPR